MRSTTKQKAQEKRSRQSNVMSDMKNVDIMLGSYSRSGLDSQLDLDHEAEGPQQNFNGNSEDFRSFLITNSRERSEMTIETARMVKNEITNQVSKKLDKMKAELNSQLMTAMNSAITDRINTSFFSKYIRDARQGT